MVRGQIRPDPWPWFGQHPETVRCVHEVLRQVRIPTVLDADGLNAFATDPDSIGDIQAPLVLTPHRASSHACVVPQRL
jgi:NAD(P)H-hydrate repair Nnr-like enzyme with NAD(P)H-hydrate dehydratase domain